MLFKIYTKYYKDAEAVCHGLIECESENQATVYAYRKAISVLESREPNPGSETFEDFHDELFNKMEFWVE